jgi:hypothetical protein
VRTDSLFQRNAPARVGGAIVTFEPGARTAWHTHPLGQTLIVTAGCGRVRREHGAIEDICGHEVFWCPLVTNLPDGAGDAVADECEVRRLLAPAPDYRLSTGLMRHPRQEQELELGFESSRARLVRSSHDELAARTISIHSALIVHERS